VESGRILTSNLVLGTEISGKVTIRP